MHFSQPVHADACRAERRCTSTVTQPCEPARSCRLQPRGRTWRPALKTSRDPSLRRLADRAFRLLCSHHRLHRPGSNWPSSSGAQMKHTTCGAAARQGSVQDTKSSNTHRAELQSLLGKRLPPTPSATLCVWTHHCATGLECRSQSRVVVETQVTPEPHQGSPSWHHGCSLRHA